MIKGFTMIEMIFVLSVMSLLAIFNLCYKLPAIDDESINHIISQKILYAKIHSINYKEQTKVIFNENELKIESDSYNDLYELPKGFTFDIYSFTYNKYGRIKIAKTVTFHGNKKDYYYKFQLGSGYFYVQS